MVVLSAWYCRVWIACRERPWSFRDPSLAPPAPAPAPARAAACAPAPAPSPALIPAPAPGLPEICGKLFRGPRTASPRLATVRCMESIDASVFFLSHTKIDA
ncbi:hypothetical protein FRC06_008348 [Ceratobasidium sp. 370]|nr:hypothetical protein FRC06_008348 [Ceratobasidium sp. 370]